MEPTAANLARADFDPHTWVDLWTRSAATSAPEDVDSRISAGVLRLQLIVQECDDRIESSMSSIMAALPRATRDLRHSAVETAAALRAVVQPSAPVAPAAGAQPAGSSLHHIAHLEVLDRVKQRLDGVRDVLQTAAAWERLSREADAALDGRNVGRLAELVRAMRSTASVLADLPGAEARARAVDDTERQFSDAVVPVLQVRGVGAGP